MSEPAALRNPFPGPQPYRAADRDIFFGREDVVRRLANRVLAHPVTTVFGPSGAGKTSLLQAGVIPRLEEAHAFRVVRVDGWPPANAPIAWLVSALYDALALGEPPAGADAGKALEEAIRLAERRSERPMLIYLDQLEQLLLPGRGAAEVETLVEGLDRLAAMPIRGLQIVLAMREDYLGRFRDRAQGRQELLDGGFRVAPLSVGELVKAVCQAAAEGVPPQAWPVGPMRELLLAVRTPGEPASDEAEVQAAFGQIVCRALWEQRIASGELDAGDLAAADAEAIVHRHLDDTLEGLGGLKGEARRLLEEHLIDREGHRTLLTEHEANAALRAGAAGHVLARLEKAAILHAEEHQGSRYFELGHDWLAAKVFQRRQEREREEAELARWGEQAKARWINEQARHVEDTRRRAAEAHRTIRAREWWIAALVFVAVAALAGMLRALAQVDGARRVEEAAKAETARARNALALVGARELLAQGRPADATGLLEHVVQTGLARGWPQVAADALAAGPPRATLRGHRGRVVSAQLGPDGQRVVTVSEDGTARVWSAEGAGDPQVLEFGAGKATSAAISPDGTRVVVASTDATARLWDTGQKTEPLQVFPHAAGLTSVVFSPSSDRILTVSSDRIARVWDVEPRRRRKSPGDHVPPLVALPHPEEITSAAFDPLGSRVVTACADGTARVWSADGRGAPLVLAGHRGRVASAAFSPDGARVVTASADGTARVWAGPPAKPIVLEGHEGEVVSAAFGAEGRRVLTVTSGGVARVWNADGAGRPVVLDGGGRKILAAAFSPDGRHIAAASEDGVVSLWKPDGAGPPVVLGRHDGPIHAVGFDGTSRRVVAACSDQAARVWDLRDPIRAAPAILAPHGGGLRAFAAHARTRRVAAASDDGAVRVWDLGAEPGPPTVFPAQDAGVTRVEIGPDGERVAAGYADGTVRVWSVTRPGEPMLLRGHGDRILDIAFDADGRRVVTASEDSTARVWRMDDADKPVVLRPGGPVDVARFSADGRSVVTASRDGVARVWSMGGGEPVALEAGCGRFLLAAFRAEDRQLVTACTHGAVHLSDARGATLKTVSHRGPLSAAALSPDGTQLVAGAMDGGVLRWNLDGKMPATRHGSHEGAVLSVQFSEDGSKVVTASDDGTARLWAGLYAVEPLVFVEHRGAAVLSAAFLGVDDIVTASSEGALLRFPYAADVINRLREATADCLEPAVRQRWLLESPADAAPAYERCERAHNRTPFFSAQGAGAP